MKKAIYTILTLAAALLLTACIKDKSTEFLVDMPAVKIAADDGIMADVLVEKTYAPVIEWAGTKPEEYDFLWTYNGREELSHEQVLVHTFSEKGEFYLTFQMTHKETGICYGQDFKLTVASQFALGWLVLSEDANKNSILSFIHMNTHELTPDIYGSVSGGAVLGKNPIRLENHCISKEDQVLVIQDNPVELSGVNFQVKSETRNEFVGGQFPEEEGGFKVAQVAYTHKGPDVMMSKNGNIYTRINGKSPTSSSAAFQDAMYSPIPFASAAGEAKYTYMVFPGNVNYQLMFDGMNRRWLAYYNTTTIPKSIPEFVKGWKTVAFDFCSGMPEDVELVYASTYNESSNNCSMINLFKQGSTYYLSNAALSLSTTNYKITVKTNVQTVFSQPLDGNSKFWLMRGGNKSAFKSDPYLFFNVGKKLYFYNVKTEAVNLYKDFSKGENAPSGNIVCMAQGGNATQFFVLFDDGHFYICDTDKTKTLQNIANGNINPEGENNLVIAHFDNIPGKPVHAIFKYGKATNFTNSDIAY